MPIQPTVTKRTRAEANIAIHSKQIAQENKKQAARSDKGKTFILRPERAEINPDDATNLHFLAIYNHGEHGQVSACLICHAFHLAENPFPFDRFPNTKWFGY